MSSLNDTFDSTPPSAAPDAPSAAVTGVTWEWAAYLALFAVALAMRLIDLGVAPITTLETHNALAAFRAVTPGASGAPLIASSPLLFLAQALGFMTLGGSESSARLVVAIIGAVLVLSPLAFRRLIGPSQAFLFALTLAFSPVLLAASRLSSPAVLSLALAVVGLWCLFRLTETRRGSYGIALVSVVALLLFGSEPGGPVLLAVLALALLIAYGWNRRANAFDFEESEPLTPGLVLRSIPWGLSLLVAVLVVFLVTTAGMLNPSGLSASGSALTHLLQAFVPAESGAPAAYPLLISVYYEPFVWVLGLAGLIVIWRRGALTFVDRFLAAWVLVGAVATALFSGAGPAYALWVTVPLAGLTARLIGELLRADDRPSAWAIPYRARFIVALAALAIVFVFTFAFQDFSRDLAQTIDGQLWLTPFQPSNLILLIVIVLLAVVCAFLAASLWDMRTVLQGIGLAVLGFGLLTSLGSGWRAARADDGSAFELWHLNTTTDVDTALLSETLSELADRESAGFDLMPLTVLAEQDGVIAWLARSFRNAEYVTDASEAVGDPIVLIDSNIVPDLGGAYVGQDMSTRRSWPLSALQLSDLPQWWTTGQPGPASAARQELTTTYLWLRQDIWQGTADAAINP